MHVKIKYIMLLSQGWGKASCDMFLYAKTTLIHVGVIIAVHVGDADSVINSML